MRKMILIGGGNTRGNIYETKEIDEEIVSLVNKTNPSFLFIGLASSYSDSYFDAMKNIYKNLGCECSYLKKKNILNNPQLVEEKIKKADIIYIGGGDTIKLITEIKQYNIDTLLQKAYANGTILVGISAGAILLSKGGFSDALILRGESDKYTYLEGLNLNNLNFCPHYEEDSPKSKELRLYLKDKKDIFYCLENCTALKIIDNKISLIKSNEYKKAYTIFIHNKKVTLKEIK